MTDQPIAKTNSGPVQGFVEDGVSVFKGVRYGAGPRAGDLPAQAAGHPPAVGWAARA